VIATILGQEVLQSVQPGQQIIKIIHDEFGELALKRERRL
jgi:signal recognition particle GTPase